MEDVVRRFLRLGLEIDQHESGMVDAYFGPPELREDLPQREPRELLADADALLADLDDGWLRDQATGLRTFAGVLAGEVGSYVEEVHGCYGVRPTHTDESVFTASHERLEALLPGPGSLAERIAKWRSEMAVPPQLVEPIVREAIARARDWTVARFGLPEGECLELELVSDKPWMGFNEYQGGLRGTVYVNMSLGRSALELLHLAIHETYPGHQAERALKERLLVSERGLFEESIVLVPAPQSLITEGIAEFGAATVLDSEEAPSFEAIITRAGIPFDLAHARAIQEALQPCHWAEVNAALLLHQEGVPDEEVHAYIKRWALVDDELASHLIRFLHEPTSRSYIIAYPAGHALCEAYAGSDPARMKRLLTEQIRVTDLTAG